jgi:hypothetical protein
MHVRSIQVLAILLLITVPSLWGCSRKAPNILEPNVEGQAAVITGGDSDSDGWSPDSRRGGDSGLPEFDADNFLRRVDNPYFPLTPGTVYRYVGETDKGVETIHVKVTRETKRLLGVRTTVVTDRVYLDGELIEDTIDWYAQDEDGNVWYFGEDTKQLENGKVVGTEGSWLAGRDGARPGIVMLARPRVGVSYEQEHAAGVAEDRARVVSLKETVSVPYGRFHRCLQTFDDTPLNPEAREYKYYARGIGLVLEVSLPDGERIELESVSRQ